MEGMAAWAAASSAAAAASWSGADHRRFFPAMDAAEESEAEGVEAGPGRCCVLGWPVGGGRLTA